MALNKDKIFKAADKHIRNNKIEKAINEYETWLKQNPKDWNTVRVVGDLYHRIGRNDEAIKSYALVADAYKRDGFNVRAIATHKMILRLDSQNEGAMRNLAELQADEGLLMEAKSHYQTLVELYNKLVAIRDKFPEESIVNLTADARIQFKIMIQVMDVLRIRLESDSYSDLEAFKADGVKYDNNTVSLLWPDVVFAVAQ